MRLRFEVQSLAALGTGTHRLPINCWRLTMLVQKLGANGVVFEDVNPVPDLELDAVAGTSHLARIVVGGVYALDGSPVNLDQVVRITNASATKKVLGFFVYEYLEP